MRADILSVAVTKGTTPSMRPAEIVPASQLLCVPLSDYASVIRGSSAGTIE